LNPVDHRRHKPSLPQAITALVACLALIFGVQVAQVATAGTASAGDTTPAGHWWAVDSVSQVNDANLAAVRAWYQGGTPQVWGRYISDLNGITLTSTEVAYARAHGIYLYLLVADHTSSCGTDSTYAQGVADAQTAIRAAQALKIPSGAVLFKDFEERSSRCPGDPGAGFMEGYFAQLQNSALYKAGFYGNSYSQSNNFAKSYCTAARAMVGFLDNTSIAASEPEPAFNNARGTVGPHNAPAWAPTKPSCALSTATTIWQYGEVGSRAGNIADIDEVVPNAPGLVAPDGTVTGSSALRLGSTAKNVLTNGGFNNSASSWRGSPGLHTARYASGAGGTNAFEGAGFDVAGSVVAGGSIYQDVPISVAPGQTYCASIQASTLGAGHGGGGSFAVWMMGGRSNQGSSRAVTGLSGSSSWQMNEVCVMATTAHTTLRIQFWPTLKGPMVALDAATIFRSISMNAGFAGASQWHVTAGTHYAVYGSSTRTRSYEGPDYMAVNSFANSGSLYQDRAAAVKAGQTYCASAQLTTNATHGGGAGTFALWLLNGASNEGVTEASGSLPAGTSGYRQTQMCITATAAHNTIRVQFFPVVGGPTVALDAVSVS
jgi:hypothetical protein